MERNQANMEAAVKAAVSEIYEKQADVVNGMLRPEFVECNYEEKTLTLSFPVVEWELNRVGVMHGGAITSTFDLTMGIMTRYFSDLNFAPTVTLETTFIRPVPLHDHLIIKIKSNLAGKTLTHLYGEGFVKSSGKLAATARATFLNVDIMQGKG